MWVQNRDVHISHIKSYRLQSSISFYSCCFCGLEKCQKRELEGGSGAFFLPRNDYRHVLQNGGWPLLQYAIKNSSAFFYVKVTYKGNIKQICQIYLRPSSSTFIVIHTCETSHYIDRGCINPFLRYCVCWWKYCGHQLRIQGPCFSRVQLKTKSKFLKYFFINSALRKRGEFLFCKKCLGQIFFTSNFIIVFI